MVRKVLVTCGIHSKLTRLSQTCRGVGGIKKLGGGAPVSRGIFGMKRAPKNAPPEMLATGGVEKIDAFINQRPLRPTHG
jgi:hypothetical protein